MSPVATNPVLNQVHLDKQERENVFSNRDSGGATESSSSNRESSSCNRESSSCNRESSSCNREATSPHHATEKQQGVLIVQHRESRENATEKQHGLLAMQQLQEQFLESVLNSDI